MTAARHPRIRLRGALTRLTLAAAAALAAGCLSGAPTEPSNDFEIDCATDAQPPAGSGRAVVRIRNFAFEPAELAVATGTEVTWINCEGAGGAAHTAPATTVSGIPTSCPPRRRPSSCSSGRARTRRWPAS